MTDSTFHRFVQVHNHCFEIVLILSLRFSCDATNVHAGEFGEDVYGMGIELHSPELVAFR